MTLDASLPADLLQWVTRFLPAVANVTDVSWPRGDSRVWRVASSVSEAYVKLSPTTEDYAREVYGYQHAVRCLAAREAPRLLSADPGLRAIMSSPLPGLVVKGLSLTAEVETRVHELAGRLLRRWHDHPEPVPAHARDDVMASMAEQADEATACLERTAEHLTDAQRALVQQVSREIPDLAEGLPLVFQHGDYSPRNWLWDAERGTQGLIDFEKSAHGLAVEDLVWLCGAVWPTRPDLKRAFLKGYGRELSDAEQRVLPLLTARLAVSYLNTGLTKQEPMLVERGRTVLGDLVRAAG
ncbi:aminoglycoside phosphotransferase family protein [Sphaerisporangium sp. NPDC051017]|uniref:aminoglycoside phosphotransferase family protein n=1 Tax=Sphaerisporangium sp. NPDC051017 TaxID=3154636 RepID=UPI0034152F81